MGTLLELDSSAGPIVIDITPGGAIQGASGADVLKKAEASFDGALRMAKAIAVSFGKAVRETANDLEDSLESAELELGFQFTGKGNVYVVQTEAQAAIKVKFVLKRPG